MANYIYYIDNMQNVIALLHTDSDTTLSSSRWCGDVLTPTLSSPWLQCPHLHRVNMYSRVCILSGSPLKKTL